MNIPDPALEEWVLDEIEGRMRALFRESDVGADVPRLVKAAILDRSALFSCPLDDDVLEGVALLALDREGWTPGTCDRCGESDMVTDRPDGQSCGHCLRGLHGNE